MFRFRIFLKSTDTLASGRLMLISMVISPLLQIIFVYGLAEGAFVGANSKSLLLISTTALIGFAVTLFASSVFTDRLNLIYTTQLAGRGLGKFLTLRFVYVWGFSLLLSAGLGVMLWGAGVLSRWRSGFSLLDPGRIGLRSQLILFVLISFAGCCIGFLFSMGSLYFRDPYKLVNLVLPFLPVLLPVLVKRASLPLGLREVSWLVPGNFTLEALRRGSPLSGAVLGDAALCAVYLLVGILAIRMRLLQWARSGRNERPF